MLNETSLYELKIRPLGRSSADEYLHQGNIWIEGRDGNPYTIDIINHSYVRTLFVVSVDGLDVIEGKSAGANSPGYVLNAKETLSIPGWKLNNKEAAEFYFSRSNDSYVNSIGGNISNTGVIGAMIFQETVSSYHVLQGCYYPTWNTGTPIWNNTNILCGTNSIMQMQTGTATLSSNRIYDSNSLPTRSVRHNLTQEIGTGFGDKTEWNTTNITFNRSTHPSSILAVYYDSARNLEKMGIKLHRKNKYLSNSADPFPNYSSSTGCQIPKNWKPSK